MENMESHIPGDLIDDINHSTHVDDHHTTNDLPSPSSATHHAPLDHDDHSEHAAFQPMLQFASGHDDLSNIPSYDAPHSTSTSHRTGAEATSQHYDAWPVDTQSQIQEDGSLRNVNQFEQGGPPNHFAQNGDPQEQSQQDQEHHINHEHQQQLQQAHHYQTHAQHLHEQQQQQQHQQHQHQNQQHQQQHAGTPYERPTLGASYGTYDGSKPKRKRASPQQLTLLNNIFEMTYFPSSELRLAIGNELDMVPRSVQIWFQNRRSGWRAKAQMILKENEAKKEAFLASGLSDVEADARVRAERAQAAARQIADQRANDAVEYAINGNTGSLAYTLHGANASQSPVATDFDDGSVTRDDEAGAWSVLQAFHQARTGILVPQGHLAMPQRPAPDSVSPQQQQQQQQQLQEAWRIEQQCNDTADSPVDRKVD